MPELPEVEVTKRALSKKLEAAQITSIDFYRDDLRYPLDKQKIRKILVKQKILAITRRAKYIHLKTEKGSVLIHLGMSGSLSFSQEKSKQKHTHISLKVESPEKKVFIHYIDPRRFGYWFAAEKDEPLTPLLHLGDEPLIDAKKLATILFTQSRKRKGPIKTFIMNQEIVVGVGNIYACEALFLSKIHPETVSSKLLISQFFQLVKAIQKVLKQAILSGGTTLKDFSQPDGKIGYFVQSLQVYGQEGKPCFLCEAKIEATRLAGRSTFYCPRCQKTA